ncbi:unnamed protein product [Clonostachys rhizophaga]|uniref:Steroid 5-alpha reductase C-terminal domain-containing protein n=1 Tax=Clonostachys rhizophaga TaxID=160324 RepID=A0A9N9V2I8_9HYPO|nr:unnamed protein product [Clonostachys rhizophaga]
MASQERKNEFIRRGIKKPSPAGTLTFVGLRSLDVLLQYQLLSGAGTAILDRVGLNYVSPGQVGALGLSTSTGLALVDRLDLPLPHLLLLGMAAGSTAKQVYWLVFVSKEEFPVSNAIPISVFNSVVNTLCTGLLLAGVTSSATAPSFPGTSLPYPYIAGPILYLLGIVTELVSEIQRKKFKDDPKNKGKVMTSGLWQYARHINYGGYAIWRAGYFVTASGLAAGLLSGSFFVWNFIQNAIPELDAYCSGRYGEQWQNFKKSVPHVLFPGLL